MTVLLNDIKLVEDEVVKKLKNYPLLKVKVENVQEQESKGLNPFASYRDRAKFEEEELTVTQLERAFKILNSIQLKVIQQKYIYNPENISDATIYTNLLLKKQVYYSIRKTAINKMAEALGII